MRASPILPLPAAGPDACEFTILDGRQSPIAAAVQRGVCRLLKAHGFATLTELPLATGRRVDVMAVSGRGEIWVVEIKSCLADLKADAKWPEYEGYCDKLYFAVPPAMPLEVMPASPGLIIGDQWDAEIVRQCPATILPAARRKAVTLRFARAAALRLHFLHDPLA
ncbi:MAG: MmcB family DNA repair protein [Pseudomonadota bacterium]|nr:MmcB family DNA repair protein [Pseudomonadota bacterium]